MCAGLTQYLNFMGTWNTRDVVVLLQTPRQSHFDQRYGHYHLSLVLPPITLPA
jgi:hypothetical protein